MLRNYCERLSSLVLLSSHPSTRSRLQCAALMYERTGRSTHKAASAVLSHSKNSNLRSNAIDTSRPGAHILALCGALGAELVTAELHDSNHEEATIKRIANDRLGLRYLTVSDMNSFGSSYCGLFWDPEDTFIIASFRGTNPTDFTEWNTDFTFQMREAGSWLRGFGKGSCVLLFYIIYHFNRCEILFYSS